MPSENMLSENAKVALITGANKGIGLEVARQLAQAGFTVLVGARDLTKGAEAAAQLTAEGLQAETIALDLNEQATITLAAETVTQKYGRLDILVNNAGIADQADGPPSQSSLPAIERTLQTNFLGAIAVTQTMLPLLRQAPAARIVNVSSGLGSLAIAGDYDSPYAAYKYIGYAASKAALNMFTVHLAYELRDTAIKVNSADPGYTATDLNGNQGHQTIPQGAAEAIRLALLPADGPTGTFSDAQGPVPW